MNTKADSRDVPSQWETALHRNDVSHGLGASLESAFYTISQTKFYIRVLVWVLYSG